MPETIKEEPLLGLLLFSVKEKVKKSSGATRDGFKQQAKEREFSGATFVLHFLLQFLAELPGTIGETLAVDGNTQGCRAMYAVFALQNPENHCPHVALDQIADPNGEFRCQTSQEIAIQTLFSASDIRFFQEFLNEHDMRPNMGFLDISK